jgi:hypothetical protein
VLINIFFHRYNTVGVSNIGVITICMLQSFKP